MTTNEAMPTLVRGFTSRRTEDWLYKRFVLEREREREEVKSKITEMNNCRQKQQTEKYLSVVNPWLFDRRQSILQLIYAL